uniref:MFS_1_like domain-containing protein n=1 Tax=Macrostomum lignano TaxID=282301 RepID=A0A1I8FCT6_9PLAT
TTKTKHGRNLDRQVQEACAPAAVPLTSRYSASFSFSAWPSIGSSVAAHFAEMGQLVIQHASTRRLIRDMARSLRRDHSAHTEASFAPPVRVAASTFAIVAPKHHLAAGGLNSRQRIGHGLPGRHWRLLGLYVACACSPVSAAFAIKPGPMISSCQALLSWQMEKATPPAAATVWLGMQIAVLIDALALAGGWLGDERVSKFKLLAVGTVLYVIGCTFILLSTLRFVQTLRYSLLVFRAVAPALLLQQLKRHFCSSIFNCRHLYYCCLNLGALVSDAIVYGSTPYVDSRKLGSADLRRGCCCPFAGLACGLPGFGVCRPAVVFGSERPIGTSPPFAPSIIPAVAAARAPAASLAEEDPSACLFAGGLLAILACWWPSSLSCPRSAAALHGLARWQQPAAPSLQPVLDPGFVFLLDAPAVLGQQPPSSSCTTWPGAS